MTKPDEYPQDVWDEALKWWRKGGCSTGDATTYAGAILAERERCADIARKHHVAHEASGLDTYDADIAAAIRKGGA